ncbi:MAG: alpha/beta fold hydrolase, partial [Candidatus Limnocylindria bacterium]
MTGPRTAVLIHGISSVPACWDRVIPALTGRYRLHAVDLFDRSRGRFSLAAAPDRLAEELGGSGAAIVIGHSMGGVIAAMLAIRHSLLVEKLVLVAAPIMPLPGTRLSQASGVLRSAARERLDIGTARLLTSGVLRAGPLPLIQALRDTLEVDLTPLLGRIAAPTLLVWG